METGDGGGAAAKSAKSSHLSILFPKRVLGETYLNLLKPRALGTLRP